MVWLVGMLAMALGHLVKGVTGFGSAIVAIPIVSLVVEPAEAIVLVTATDLVAGSWLAWSARARVRWPVVGAILAPLVVTQWLGTDLLAWMPVHTARLALAALIGILALSMLWRPVREDVVDAPDDAPLGRVAWGLAIGAGGVAGMMSGLFGAPGPPLVAWVRRYLSDACGRAVLLAVFVPSSWALVAMILAKGIVPAQTAMMALGLIPASMIGAAIGSRLAGKVAPDVFGRAVGAVLLSAAISLAVGG